MKISRTAIDDVKSPGTGSPRGRYRADVLRMRHARTRREATAQDATVSRRARTSLAPPSRTVPARRGHANWRDWHQVRQQHDLGVASKLAVAAGQLGRVRAGRHQYVFITMKVQDLCAGLRERCQVINRVEFGGASPALRAKGRSPSPWLAARRHSTGPDNCESPSPGTCRQCGQRTPDSESRNHTRSGRRGCRQQPSPLIQAITCDQEIVKLLADFRRRGAGT